MPEPGELRIQTDDGVLLSGERAGSGTAIVLLHGLTASRRYVVMGSRLLERSGLQMIAYDARGHGRSTPAPSPADYLYARLSRDLSTVLDALAVEHAILAGASMGAHTILRFALDHPERVLALGLITPAFDPRASRTAAAHAGWDALARGLRERGVEGFVEAYDLMPLPEELRGTVEQVLRQRMLAHEHPLAVADALEAVPRSQPFGSFEELAAIEAPTLVVASRDEADPGHPLAVAERYGEAIPGARLELEEASSPPRSPLAWQGGRLSRLLLELAAAV